MIDSAIWIELMTLKILFRELRGKFFTLGNLELADIPGLRQGMILFTYGTDPSECPAACRALTFLATELEGSLGVFNGHGSN
jgi:hypothetical protein